MVLVWLYNAWRGAQHVWFVGFEFLNYLTFLEIRPEHHYGRGDLQG